MRGALIVLLFLLFCGCSPSSSRDFQKEGEALKRHLLKELRMLENPDELSRAEPILKKRFVKLMELIIEAHIYLEHHPEERPALDRLEEDEALMEELQRIQKIEGGFELLERVQKEALLYWDRYSKRDSKEERFSRKKLKSVN